MLICPVCSEALVHSGKTLSCPGGHSFDIARSGYCNLLTGTKNGSFIGDSREMVVSRRNFLDTGAYEPLREAVAETVKRYLPYGEVSILDAGCGEGYYTSAVVSYASVSGRKVSAIGIDISKNAADFAARRDKLTRYITASSYHLPASDKCADILMSLFAPVPSEEFGRVLKDSGRLILAVPGKEHLWELKKAIYDDPYENDEDKHSVEGFTLIEKEKLCYKTHIGSSENIRSLFSMTPYIHRTGKESMDRLKALNELDTTLSFLILVFEKTIP